MRFMNKSDVAPIAKLPTMTDDNICIAFDSIHLNPAAADSVHKCSDCDDTQPAGTDNGSPAIANSLKASIMRTLKTDGAIVPKAIQVQPKFVRKTPKFPSRERHMAIRRKKTPPTVKIPSTKCRFARPTTNGKCDTDDDATE